MSNRIWQQSVSVENGVGYLRLEHPDGRSATHLFSPHHLAAVSAINWCPYGRGYVMGWNGHIRIGLHQLVWGVIDNSLTIDHINRVITDSRDENLRQVSRREQANNWSNQSVTPCIQEGKGGYQVHFKWNGLYIFSPSFINLEKAQQTCSVYAVIAARYDNGQREIPTRQELKTIADTIRGAK